MPLEIVRSAPAAEVDGDSAAAVAAARDDCAAQLQKKLAELADLGLTTPERAEVVLGDPAWVGAPGEPASCVVQGHIAY